MASSTIPVRLEGARWFCNPFLSDPTAGCASVTSQWISESVDALSHRITQRKITADELDGGVYTGVAGISYALLRVARLKKDCAGDSSDSIYVDAARKLLEYQLPHARKVNVARYSRYLTGSLGLEVLTAIIGHLSGDLSQQAKLSEVFRGLLPTILTPGYQRIGDDEIMNGRAGFLAAELEIRLWTGNQPILTDIELRSVLEAMLHSGRDYSRRHSSAAPLMYQWHDKEYLGAAHGISGIYQIFLSFWPLLDDKARLDVRHSLDWYLSLQSPDGNFPSSGGKIGHTKGDDELVHWCHGAVGVMQLLVAAYSLFEENSYLQSAERCAELIWRKGLLRKGFGICHGVAGSGYAFLALFRATGNEVYLQRAKCFALFLMNPVFEKTARTPDSSYSLFEGWAGALCFIADLMEPSHAQFPMVPVNFSSAVKQQ